MAEREEIDELNRLAEKALTEEVLTAEETARDEVRLWSAVRIWLQKDNQKHEREYSSEQTYQRLDAALTQAGFYEQEVSTPFFERAVASGVSFVKRIYDILGHPVGVSAMGTAVVFLAVSLNTAQLTLNEMTATIEVEPLVLRGVAKPSATSGVVTDPDTTASRQAVDAMRQPVAARPPATIKSDDPSATLIEWQQFFSEEKVPHSVQFLGGGTIRLTVTRTEEAAVFLRSKGVAVLNKPSITLLLKSTQE